MSELPDPGTPSEEDTNPSPPSLGLHAASLPCETCGTVRPHRIVHLSRGPRAGGQGPATGRHGIARCRVCGSVHAFVIGNPAGSVSVSVVVSDGARSERIRTELPTHRRIQVGSGVPESGAPWIVRGIDRQDGRRVPEARSEEIATLWVERDRGPTVALSIIEGRRTRSITLSARPEAEFAVGDILRVDREEVRVVRIRARGVNWERPGKRFEAREIQRVYARRSVRPPAGKRPWSRERDRPVSRESSASRSARSRSSPGVSRNRAVPRRQTALSGATVHRSRPS